MRKGKETLNHRGNDKKLRNSFLNDLKAEFKFSKMIKFYF